MKRLIARLVVIVLLSLTFLAYPVYAKDTDEETVVVLEKSEVVNKDYFAAGDTVRVSGTVNGDAYVAGGNIVIDGTINGDLLVAGGTVQVSGPVKNDIRAAGGVVMLNDTVGGNVTIGAGTAVLDAESRISGSLLVGAGSLSINGAVGKDVTAGTGTFILNAPVGGDMTLAVEEMALQPKAKVAGDLTYWSETELSTAVSSAVSGETIYHAMPESEPKPVNVPSGKGITGMLMGMVSTVVLVSMAIQFILGLILITLFPVFSRNTVTMLQKNPWGAFGLGFFSVVAIPLLGIAAMMTVVGIPLGIVLFVIVWALCTVANVYAALYVGSGVFTKLDKDVHRAWQLLVGILVLAVCTLIPVLGWLVRAVLVLMGLGALILEKQAVYRQLRAKHLI